MLTARRIVLEYPGVHSKRNRDSACLHFYQSFAVLGLRNVNL